MPRKSPFPLHSFGKSFSLTQFVHKLGGSVTREVCAFNLGKSVSGPFQSLIGSTVKYGLITVKKNILTTTDAFQRIHLAYTDDEALEEKRALFLSIELFQDLFEHIDKKHLPVGLLRKIIIKEFHIPEKQALTIASVFSDSMTELYPMNTKKSTQEYCDSEKSENEFEETKEASPQAMKQLPPTTTPVPLPEAEEVIVAPEPIAIQADETVFELSIKGPNLDLHLDIKGIEDLHILDSIVHKLRRQLSV